MDWLPTSDSHTVLYSQASAIQLSLALIAAREALDPYYPELTWPQWHQAFKTVQPTLILNVNQVAATANGLTELIHYFEARHLSAGSVSPQEFSTANAPEYTDLVAESVFQFNADARLELKNTYCISYDVAEGLKRVSFWRRESKSALVNLALMQLLVKYPELQFSVPATKTSPRLTKIGPVVAAREAQ